MSRKQLQGDIINWRMAIGREIAVMGAAGAAAVPHATKRLKPLQTRDRIKEIPERKEKNIRFVR